MAETESSSNQIAGNRKAFHDYFVIERFEAGIELRGTEVKSCRDGHVSLTGGFARVEDGQVILRSVNIAPYNCGNIFNHDPIRPRRLLLHSQQIRKLEVHSLKKGCTIVPLNAYFKRGKVKIEIGLCKGKQHGDKRETLRRKTVEREAQRDIAAHRRR